MKPVSYASTTLLFIDIGCDGYILNDDNLANEYLIVQSLAQVKVNLPYLSLLMIENTDKRYSPSRYANIVLLNFIKYT